MIHKDKEKVVTIEEEEKMNLDIENIASTSQQIWRLIYEFIHDDHSKEVKFFPEDF